MEQGWTEREKEPSGPGSGYLKLADGEKVYLRLLTAPVRYRKHWNESARKSTLCSKHETGACDVCDDTELDRDTRYARFTFSIPVFVFGRTEKGKKYNEQNEVLIWEQGGKVFDTLAATVCELPNNGMDTTFAITRLGERQQTAYTLVPTNKAMDLPPGLEIPDLSAYYAERISGVKLRNPKAGTAPEEGAADADDTPDYGDPFAEE